ncbi:hypothetical protein BDV98DRAFT_48088 [Pterulicium gracile]|uniref:Uncharacterized protein n=1 Tax=Pterulicium gracile TaxID=1884261 RepID=A0A5C3QP08_9AGAR|nr:hypothetical protein BDV98DRAFT_48088 [Pterula gracilis]
MTDSSTGPRPTSTKEFARLMDFFDRLAVHRARSTSKSVEPTQDENEVFIPNDIAPLIRGLKSQIANRTDSEDPSVPQTIRTFPVKEGFPFTFKMRLHELYELKDWAKKISQEVEKSRSEYRSLSEQEPEIGTAVEEELDIAAQVVIVRPRRVSAMARWGRRSAGWERSEFSSTSAPGMGSRRSSSRSSLLSPGLRTSFRPSTLPPITSAKSTIVFPFVREQLPTMDSGLADDVRVVKKRCVGQTKSLVSGLPPFVVEKRRGKEEQPVQKNTWVYQGVVSSTEVELDCNRAALRNVQPIALRKILGKEGLGAGGEAEGENVDLSEFGMDKKSVFGVLG